MYIDSYFLGSKTHNDLLVERAGHYIYSPPSPHPHWTSCGASCFVPCMVHVLNQIMIHVLMYLRRTKKFDMFCKFLKGFENHHHKQVRFVININILAITRNDCIWAFHLNIPVTELCTPSHIPIPHPSSMWVSNMHSRKVHLITKFSQKWRGLRTASAKFQLPLGFRKGHPR
jgi:hypothetical protein